MKKPHLAGIVSALVTAAGVIASPPVTALLPATWSSVLTGIGIILQAITKPVHAGSTDLVPKDQA